MLIDDRIYSKNCEDDLALAKHFPPAARGMAAFRTGSKRVLSPLKFFTNASAMPLIKSNIAKGV
jgi:hypothetical protein